MQTKIHDSFKHMADIPEAESILRSCVHCGFCNATCPTYQLTFDERDGPRGRIYLVKQLLESGQATEKTRVHLDRCLTCRNCETTCPSGVEYGRLLDVGREILEVQLPRPLPARIVRWYLRKTIAYRNRFSVILKLGQLAKPLLPTALKRKIPAKEKLLTWPTSKHDRVMIPLKGCVQSSATPNTNIYAARVLDRLDISLVDETVAGCCGAVSYHLGYAEEGKTFFRRNIDAWWPLVESGAEALVVTASGCGSMIKDYGSLLRDDPEYADKAKRISAMAKDLSEVMLDENLASLTIQPDDRKIAIHCPCSLQHAQKLPTAVDRVMKNLGFTLADTIDKNTCCGSAGTYSILQPRISQELLSRKITSLSVDNPDTIVTANVGCQLDLDSISDVPVKHWIETVYSALETK